MAEINLHPSWLERLRGDFDSAPMQALRAFLAEERAAGKRIFPSPEHWFAALDLTPLPDVRVVILGQDPYHGEGQAHGLAFSVQPGVRTPPSLANIYKELASDLGIPPAHHGHLTPWARQGVLLLNTALTVEEGRAASHRGRGWEHFTDAIIALVNAKTDPVVFMLWGNDARKKAAAIDRTRHLILTAPHPSPLSAYSGFFGCRHFSKANDFLGKHGREPIDWALPDCA